MKIGTAIKDRRKKLKLSQVELAEKCSITQTYLSQIESNSKEPSIPTLKQISTALEIPLPVLLLISIEDDDIAKSKQEAYNKLKPMLNDVFESVFNI